MIIAYDSSTGRVLGIYQGVHAPISGDSKESNSEVPVPDNIPNMEATLMYNSETDKLYYNYISVESLESRLAAAEEKNASLAEENTMNQLALMELHAMLLSLMPE